MKTHNDLGLPKCVQLLFSFKLLLRLVDWLLHNIKSYFRAKLNHCIRMSYSRDTLRYRFSAILAVKSERRPITDFRRIQTAQRSMD